MRIAAFLLVGAALLGAATPVSATVLFAEDFDGGDDDFSASFSVATNWAPAPLIGSPFSPGTTSASGNFFFGKEVTNASLTVPTLSVNTSGLSLGLSLDLAAAVSAFGAPSQMVLRFNGFDIDTFVPTGVGSSLVGTVSGAILTNAFQTVTYSLSPSITSQISFAVQTMGDFEAIGIDNIVLSGVNLGGNAIPEASQVLAGSILAMAFGGVTWWRKRQA